MLEKTVSDSFSASSPDRQGPADEVVPSTSKHRDVTRGREDDQDSPHPLVSKDSHGSSAGNMHQEVLVPGPNTSKESPAAATGVSKSPDVSAKDPKEWHGPAAALPLLSSPGSTVSSTKHHPADKPSTEVVRFQPSPAMGWPQRSPIKPEHHDHEVASFALFTQSFDTLSETGHHFFRASPEKATAASDHQQHQHQHQHSPKHQHPPRKIQVGGRHTEMGDISPIKLEDHHHPRHPEQRSEGFRHHPHEGRPDGDRHHQYLKQQGNGGPPPVDFPAPQYGHETTRTTHHQHRSAPATYNANGYSTTASNPFFVLRSVRKAFDQCAYKLPCLYDQDVCPVHLSHYASSIHRFEDHADRMGYHEMELACRRVESAVHAFGGYTTVRPMTRSNQAIFRDRNSSEKEYYDKSFHQRYVVAGNHISWEVESNPPVRCHPGSLENGGHEQYLRYHHNDNHGDEDGRPNGGPGAGIMESPGGSSGSVVPMDSQQQKMKYRCKLCGQLKQNHNCPYQQSLQRSIAVMVYPAVNAFTACEPGVLTKPLSEMNNFVSYDDALSPDPYHHNGEGVSPEVPAMDGRGTHVTPETTKTRLLHHSPESSLSTHSGHHHHPPRQSTTGPSPHRGGRKRSHDQVETATASTTPPATDRTTVRPTPYFVPSTLTLRPEHYRAVAPRKPKSGGGSSNEEYQYPHVPLTFQERKRLSDTVFFLSKEIPTMTSPVASLLRMGREKGEWDLAVAQVLAQLVVALYCAEGDYCLDGLQRYLLDIGISC